MMGIVRLDAESGGRRSSTRPINNQPLMNHETQQDGGGSAGPPHIYTSPSDGGGEGRERCTERERERAPEEAVCRFKWLCQEVALG